MAISHMIKARLKDQAKAEPVLTHEGSLQSIVPHHLVWQHCVKGSRLWAQDSLRRKATPKRQARQAEASRCKLIGKWRLFVETGCYEQRNVNSIPQLRVHPHIFLPYWGRKSRCRRVDAILQRRQVLTSGTCIGCFIM